MSASAGREVGEWLGLVGQVCVVTGAGSGIGAETARQFAAVGALVAVLDRDANAAAAVADDIARSGGRAIAVLADVGDAASIAAAAVRIHELLGPCRVLVNNAAVRHRESLVDFSLDAWNQVLAVNLTGAMVCAQTFAAQMIAAGQGGSMVHVSSIVGLHPQQLGAAYGVSKAGLDSLSRSLALELAPHRIRSNVVSPGLVITPANAESYRDPATAAARDRLIPTGRVASPEDLAPVILFLASDRAGYVDGQNIAVDGGFGNTLMSQVPRVHQGRPV